MNDNNLTNLEKIAIHIRENGPNSIVIDSIPGRKEWLIAFKNKQGLFMIFLGNPDHKKTIFLGETDRSNYLEIIGKILELKNLRKIKKAELTQTFKNMLQEVISKNTNIPENTIEGEQDNEEIDKNLIQELKDIIKEINTKICNQKKSTTPLQGRKKQKTSVTK